MTRDCRNSHDKLPREKKNEDLLLFSSKRQFVSMNVSQYCLDGQGLSQVPQQYI